MHLGLIAGGGRFPLVILDAARAQGHDVTVVAATEEADGTLTAAAERHGVPIHWISLGELGKCIKLLKAAGIDRAVMVGYVKHTRIFAKGRIIPDFTLLSLLGKLVGKNTDGILGALVDVFRDHGIEVMDSTALISPLLAGAGALSARALREEERQDIEWAYRFADAIAGLDIGQSIAVKDRAVVAVEAMEGTDEVIRRAGLLAGGGFSLVKVAKPNQDMRFDVPVVGLATIAALQAAGGTALSIDAGRTRLLDGPAVLAAADVAGVAVWGRPVQGGNPAPGTPVPPGARQ